MNKHYEVLMNFANDLFTVEDIPFRWSTQDCMTLDSIPYIGNFTSNTPNLYIATGFQKWGYDKQYCLLLSLLEIYYKR